jgi:4-amino-4-deoxy-L-arabinose transferase-like glycosyltransferase
VLTTHVRASARETAVRPVASPRVRTAIGLLFVLLVAGALRAYQLRDQPVFLDEDQYTVSVIRLDSLSPVSIGRMAAQVVKPPLPLLSQALLTHVTGDAVTAGRLVSASGGLATTLLTYFLGRRLSQDRASAGLLAALAYALSPVAVLHERMVLPDSLLTATALAAVLFSWSAVEQAGPRLAALAATIGFFAVQMKLPGVVTAVAPAPAVLANLPLTRRRAGVAALAVAGPVASYLFLRLSPLGPYLAVQDDARLALFTSWQANSEVLWDSAQTYVPAGIGALSVLGTVWMARVKPAYLVVVLGMLGVWVAPWLFISNFAPSRYYLPAVPYLAALAGVGAMWLIDGSGRRRRSARTLASVTVVGALGTLGVLAEGVAVDRPSAHLSQLDDWQYRSGWPAGVLYARAAELVLRSGHIDGRIYMINWQHLIAAGAFDAAPGQSWVVSPGGAFPPNAQGELLVMIDNVHFDATGQLVELAPRRYLDQLRRAAPDAELVGYFPQPDSNNFVAVLHVRRA